MGFLSLLEVASMPVLQFLLIGFLGAFLASGYSNILSSNARRDINKVVFVVFTPSMVFVSLAKTVDLQEIISWWFMPVNVMISFLIGGSLAWIMLKIVRVEPHLENLIIATCSAGNVGNMLLIIVPAICHEDNNPFGEESVCHYRALSYVSLSMALGEVYVWTHSYSLMRKSGVLYDKIRYGDSSCEILSIDSEVSEEALRYQSSIKPTTDIPSQENTLPLLSRNRLDDDKASIWDKFKQNLRQFAKELLAPSTIAAIIGLTTGVVPWLKSLFIGTTAPLRVIADSATTLGHAMLPCIPLLLGGNLTKGAHKSALKPAVIVVIVLVRYIILPIAGIGVIKAAGQLGFLPQDPLYSYVLLLQFTVPPATSISTMAQLFEVGKEECAIIFLWTYLAAAVALTVWSTIFMLLLS